jgi:prepilin-type N-terminal cleavage/methylation domain-containing protein
MRRPGGFTLVEVLIALVLLTIVMGSLFAVIVRAQRDYVRQREAVRALEGLRMAEGAITAVLRSAGSDPYDRGGAGIDPDPLGHGAFDNLRVVSDFNPADADAEDEYEDVEIWIEADTLKARWQADEAGRPMVYPVESLEFWYYDANGDVITDADLVSDAARVRFRIETPKDQRSGTTERREAWVYLRNTEAVAAAADPDEEDPPPWVEVP